MNNWRWVSARRVESGGRGGGGEVYKVTKRMRLTQGEQGEMSQRMESITLIGGIFITSTSIITVIWYIFVLIAEYISIVEAESFILLTSQSICDICSLLQYVLLGIEILIGNELFHLSPRWSSFIHSTFEMIALPHYLIIGLSRATGVILPTRMSTFWTKRYDRHINDAIIELNFRSFLFIYL
uniref:G_PROTEIN_RECEP_F1_2 domain-containing protein n=1 Tax=Ascaris lumbricoides TaxID=6252 RepID=A0A0M3IEL5_ASCLU